MAHMEAAKSGQIREGSVFATTLKNQPVAITRVEGTPYAFENKCPHIGLKLNRGKVEGRVLTCPFHGSTFDVCTGRNLDWVGAFMGIKVPGWTRSLIAMGKTPAGLKLFPCFERDGTVFVDL